LSSGVNGDESLPMISSNYVLKDEVTTLAKGGVGNSAMTIKVPGVPASESGLSLGMNYRQYSIIEYVNRPRRYCDVEKSGF